MSATAVSSVREKALDTALNLAHQCGLRTPDEVIGAAGKFENYLTGGTIVAPAQITETPATPAAAPRKRTPKPTETPPAQPVGEFGETQTATQPAAAAADPAKLPDKKLTQDDVRAKLVAVQSAYGTKDKSIEQIKKVVPSGLLSGVKEEQYAELIRYCDEALASAPKK